MRKKKKHPQLIHLWILNNCGMEFGSLTILSVKPALRIQKVNTCFPSLRLYPWIRRDQFNYYVNHANERSGEGDAFYTLLRTLYVLSVTGYIRILARLFIFGYSTLEKKKIKKKKSTFMTNCQKGILINFRYFKYLISSLLSLNSLLNFSWLYLMTAGRNQGNGVHIRAAESELEQYIDADGQVGIII